MEDKLQKKQQKDYRNAYREKVKLRIHIEFVEEDQANYIRTQAANSGLPINTYARELLLKNTVKAVSPNHRLSLELKAQIMRIGNNANQIARSLNTKHANHDVVYLRNQIDAITNELRLIRESFSS